MDKYRVKIFNKYGIFQSEERQVCNSCWIHEHNEISNKLQKKLLKKIKLVNSTRNILKVFL